MSYPICKTAPMDALELLKVIHQVHLATVDFLLFLKKKNLILQKKHNGMNRTCPFSEHLADM